MIEKIFGIQATGERVELNFEKLLLVTRDNIELEIDFHGPCGADFTLHAVSNCLNKQFSTIDFIPWCEQFSLSKIRNTNCKRSWRINDGWNRITSQMCKSIAKLQCQQKNSTARS